MDMSHLARRYTFGSNDLDFSMPGTFHHEFFFAMPSNVRALTELSKQIVYNHKQNYSNLRSMYADEIMALNEISRGLNALNKSVEDGFRTLTDAVYYLEESLRMELGQIKWVLVQIDSKFAELLHLIKFPRETEAGELIGDGLKAMEAGNIDDAEPCFREALGKKRTSFQANLNLGFVLLNKGDGAGAVLHFKKAVDYSPKHESVDIIALENYARALFAVEDYSGARDAMFQALKLRQSRKRFSDKSEYHMSVYLALAGDHQKAISLIVDLCRRVPKYFEIAATDKDLESIRAELMKSLNKLTQEEHAKASHEFAKVSTMYKELDTKTKHRASTPSEMAEIDSALKRTRELIEKSTYTDSVKALEGCAQILLVLKELPVLTSAVKEKKKLDEEIAAIKSEVDHWSKLEAEEYQKDRIREAAFDRETENMHGMAKEGYFGCPLGCLFPIVGMVILVKFMTTRERQGIPYGLVEFSATILWLASPFIGYLIGAAIVGRIQKGARQRRYASTECYEQVKSTLQGRRAELSEKQNQSRILTERTARIRSMVWVLQKVGQT